jgi:predicted nucleic acid-binding protein
MGSPDPERAASRFSPQGIILPLIHVDTSFLIRALVPGTTEDRTLRSWITAGTPLAMSAVGWAELLCGPLEEAHLALVRRIVSHIAPFEVETAALAAHLFNRSGRRRGTLADCMIAATAMNAGAMLASSNPADFKRLVVEGLQLADMLG